MQYELFYLVGEKKEANLEAIREEVSQMLTQEGATLVDPEIIEKRKLAYEIKHEMRGTYVTRRFDLADVDYWADESNLEKEFGIGSITKKLNLNNNVLRSIIVRTDEIPPLGSKEERKARELSQQKQQRPERKEKPKTVAQPAKPIKKEEAKAKTEETAKKEAKEEENIDKKLEEILNI